MHLNTLTHTLARTHTAHEYQINSKARGEDDADDDDDDDDDEAA